MNYRGIEYTTKAKGKGREWDWCVHLPNGTKIEGTVKGIKFRAMIASEEAIDRWLKEHPEGT
jgi:hypothetical protein